VAERRPSSTLDCVSAKSRIVGVTPRRASLNRYSIRNRASSDAALSLSAGAAVASCAMFPIQLKSTS